MRYIVYALTAALAVAPAAAQTNAAPIPDMTAPTNDAPNPYRTIKDNFKLPEGRTWGSTSAVEIDRDGKSIWVAERCGQNGCIDRKTGTMSDLPSVLKFDAERQAGEIVRRRPDDFPARHLCRPR